jgi:hypothetical protein
VACDVTPADDLRAERVKHLELIQGVISRLGNGAFFVKGWTVTVSGVFLGLAVNSDNPGLAIVSILPTLAFWGLDTYFLRSERLFRALYEHVRKGSDQVQPFFMAATSAPFLTLLAQDTNTMEIGSWWRTAIRPTLWVFYVAVIASAALVAVVVCKT